MDSDEQTGLCDVDWLQREHELDPIQIQRREYGIRPELTKTGSGSCGAGE